MDAFGPRVGQATARWLGLGSSLSSTGAAAPDSRCKAIYTSLQQSHRHCRTATSVARPASMPPDSTQDTPGAWQAELQQQQQQQQQQQSPPQLQQVNPQLPQFLPSAKCAVTCAITCPLEAEMPLLMRLVEGARCPTVAHRGYPLSIQSGLSQDGSAKLVKGCTPYVSDPKTNKITLWLLLPPGPLVFCLPARCYAIEVVCGLMSYLPFRLWHVRHAAFCTVLLCSRSCLE